MYNFEQSLWFEVAFLTMLAHKPMYTNETGPTKAPIGILALYHDESEILKQCWA